MNNNTYYDYFTLSRETVSRVGRLVYEISVIILVLFIIRESVDQH